MEGPGEEVLEEDREEERVENVVEKADKASEGGDKEEEAVEHCLLKIMRSKDWFIMSMSCR